VRSGFSHITDAHIADLVDERLAAGISELERSAA
jgi:hypothetical protein